MVAEFLALAALILMIGAEWTHARRVRALARLAFGPNQRPALWAYLAPPLRIVAVAALSWGLVTLMLLPPKVHKLTEIPDSELRDLVLVLDVSPSMRLADAGPDRKQSRRTRAATLLQSFFERVPMELFRTSVVAFYTGEAKPVVVRTTDPEVVRNILEDLPMEYAFKAGATDLFSGLSEAFRIAKPWRPRSTIVVVVSDGDTVPPTGMPRKPDSVSHVVVVGVGDVRAGRFIDGHLSRQDASSLRQLAVRLGGVYHDGNEKHLSSALLEQITLRSKQGLLDRLTRREYALIACTAGASVLSLLPLLLNLAGTTWRPGVRPQKRD